MPTNPSAPPLPTETSRTQGKDSNATNTRSEAERTQAQDQRHDETPREDVSELSAPGDLQSGTDSGVRADGAPLPLLSARMVAAVSASVI